MDVPFHPTLDLAIGGETRPPRRSSGLTFVRSAMLRSCAACGASSVCSPGRWSGRRRPERTRASLRARERRSLRGLLSRRAGCCWQRQSSSRGGGAAMPNRSDTFGRLAAGDFWLGARAAEHRQGRGAFAAHQDVSRAFDGFGQPDWAGEAGLGADRAPIPTPVVFSCRRELVGDRGVWGRHACGPSRRACWHVRPWWGRRGRRGQQRGGPPLPLTMSMSARLRAGTHVRALRNRHISAQDGAQIRANGQTSE